MSSEVTPSTTLYNFLAWAELNKNKLILVALAVLILMGVLWIGNYSVIQKEITASQALSQLEVSANASDLNRPGATEYLKIAAQYPRTDAAERAKFLAAGALFEAGQYEEARAQFETFRQQHPSSKLVPAASLGVAAALEAQGKSNEAFAAYEMVNARHPNDPVATQARLGAARIFEARQQPEQALRIYQDLTRATFVSIWSSEASRKRDELLRRHPQLATPEPAVTNAPAPIKTNP